MSVPDRFAISAPPERIGRGTRFALLIVPIGVIAWASIWSFGFIVGAVILGVAVLAWWLYRWGAGGRVGYRGAAIIAGVTVLTLLLGFFVGTLTDLVPLWRSLTGDNVWEALRDPQFWDAWSRTLFDAQYGYPIEFAVATAFAAIGCGTVFRAIYLDARAQSKLGVVLPHPDEVP